MPTDEEVDDKVKTLVGEQANYSSENITDEMELMSQPLMLDGTGINFLSIELTNYIKEYNVLESITPSEIEDAETVEKLVETTNKKISG